MGGSVFAKFAGRSPKDCSNLDRTVKSVRDLIMLVKMSEYLTEGLCEDEEGADLVIRSYRSLFERQLDEFRVYVVHGKMVGV